MQFPRSEQDSLPAGQPGVFMSYGGADSESGRIGSLASSGLGVAVVMQQRPLETSNINEASATADLSEVPLGDEPSA